MKSVYKQAGVALAVLVALNAQAAAPVSDLSGDSGSSGVVLSGNNGAIVPTGSLEDRVALLERTLNARLRLQAELQQQVDSLQGEVSELRGQLEQQTYQMEQSQEPAPTLPRARQGGQQPACRRARNTCCRCCNASCRGSQLLHQPG
jgi:TolA-binding protein